MRVTFLKLIFVYNYIQSIYSNLSFVCNRCNGVFLFLGRELSLCLDIPDFKKNRTITNVLVFYSCSHDAYQNTYLKSNCKSENNFIQSDYKFRGIFLNEVYNLSGNQ